MDLACRSKRSKIAIDSELHCQIGIGTTDWREAREFCVSFSESPFLVIGVSMFSPMTGLRFATIGSRPAAIARVSEKSHCRRIPNGDGSKHEPNLVGFFDRGRIDRGRKS
jgi:hypothetical protein